MRFSVLGMGTDSIHTGLYKIKLQPPSTCGNHSPSNAAPAPSNPEISQRIRKILQEISPQHVRRFPPLLGVYYYRIEIDRASTTNTMVLVKLSSVERPHYPHPAPLCISRIGMGTRSTDYFVKRAPGPFSPSFRRVRRAVDRSSSDRNEQLVPKTIHHSIPHWPHGQGTLMLCLPL